MTTCFAMFAMLMWSVGARHNKTARATRSPARPVRSWHALAKESAAAHFAFRLTHQKLSPHVGMDVTRERNLTRFADSCRGIWTGFLLELQGHRLSRLQVIGPISLPLRTSDFHAVAFLLHDAFLEHG